MATILSACRAGGPGRGGVQPYAGANPVSGSIAGRQGTLESTTRTTCPVDDVVGGSCVRNLHQQPLEFWQQYQQEAPALREGFFTCAKIRDDFGDWVRIKRNELGDKDRQENMETGYLPHVIVVESDYVIQQMATSFQSEEYNQIIAAGARPELCRERSLFWKAQILAITEKFPPLR
ncbi:hypothetical protein [Azospirillum doebereinerae]